jgi:hypothetical protein
MNLTIRIPTLQIGIMQTVGQLVAAKMVHMFTNHIIVNDLHS